MMKYKETAKTIYCDIKERTVDITENKQFFASNIQLITKFCGPEHCNLEGKCKYTFRERRQL